MSFSGQGLKNFYIGITNDAPSSVVPSTSPVNYPVCAYYNGMFPSARQRVPCDTKMNGRHVIVQLTELEALTLCEVEVYGGQYYM